jgi:hypothetical protein
MADYHRNFKDEQIHVPFFKVYNNVTERNTPNQGFTSDHLRKVVLQLDNWTVWILYSLDIGGGVPGWKPMGGAFNTGVRLLFNNDDAPVGWTRITSSQYDNAALRLIGTGTPSTGGTVEFRNGTNGVFDKSAVDGSSLSANQNGVHGGHGGGLVGYISVSGYDSENNYTTPYYSASQNSNGGSTHTHTIDLRVKYVDFLLAQKD